MQDEKKEFVKTLCTISVTMASISFVGVAIIMTIYYQTKLGGWLDTAYGGILAVSFFAMTSIFALIQLYPRKKKTDKTIWHLTLTSFVIGWVMFGVMMYTLIQAFRPVV
jgi:hypothetical protein